MKKQKTNTMYASASGIHAIRPEEEKMIERPELIQTHKTNRNEHLLLKAIIGCIIGLAAILMLASAPHAETVEIGIAPPESESESVVTIAPNPYQMIIDNLTPEDEAVLKRIVWAEANNQSITGQRAVYEVIFNRMLSSNDWGQSGGVIGVLSKRGQFATWKSRNKVKSNADQDEALRLVYSEPPVLPSTKYVFFDRHGRNGRDKIKIEGHYFGAEK